MALKIALTADEQRVVTAERDAHPDPCVRRRMLSLWSCHCGVTRETHPSSVLRVPVRAASGRQRFNVLAAWDAVTPQLTAVTNTTAVNAGTLCELLRAVAARGLAGPVTMVLEDAR